MRNRVELYLQKAGTSLKGEVAVARTHQDGVPDAERVVTGVSDPRCQGLLRGRFTVMESSD